MSEIQTSQNKPANDGEAGRSVDFVRSGVAADTETKRFEGRVHTRFPPEPNGYLHIGHAKSICLNFGLAAESGGLCNLRFDDTNPTKEETEYVDSIMEDIRWLGFDWADRLYFASDYFDHLYSFAIQLIKEGKASNYIKRGIRERIRQCSVTVVYVSVSTANSKWVDWEIRESLAMGKGVVAMHKGETPPKQLPKAITENKIQVVPWTQKQLTNAIQKQSENR